MKCCHWARTTNIDLLYPKVRSNIGGDIPIDVPPYQNIGGDVSPASPAALTPVLFRVLKVACLLSQFNNAKKYEQFSQFIKLIKLINLII